MAKLHIKKLQVLPYTVNVALILPEVDYDFITLPTTLKVKLIDIDKYRFKDEGNFCRVWANLDEEVITPALNDKIVQFNKIDDTILTVNLTEELQNYDYLNIYLEADELPSEEDRDPDVYIVSPEFIRNQSNISSNIQDKFLQTALREVTDIDYRSLVGSKMLKKLKCLIYDEKIYDMDNIHYLNLLNYSKYYLLYMVTYRILPVISVKLDNAGAYQTSDEHVEPVSIDDTFKMASYYEKRANYYKKLIQQYIINNINKLPEVTDVEINQINANLKSASMTSVWLGGKVGKKYKF